MSILSGFFKTKRYRKTTDGYKLESNWTSGNTVELDDGNTVQNNVGAIKGITTSTSVTETGYAADATTVAALNESLDIVRSHVGMIVQSTTLDTEAKVISIYGGTAWSKIEGRFLLGASSAYKVNSTGGETAHTLTVSEIPSHNHKHTASGQNCSAGYGLQSGSVSYAGSVALYNDNSHYTEATGGGAAHNNMPPYKSVYIWERTE